jgi:hypothetical protein
MAFGVKRPVLLTKAQLDNFRSQVASRQEAQFLAPQLLEQIAILTGHLSQVLARVDAALLAVAELERDLAEASTAGSDCRHCHDARLRAGLKKIRAVIGTD